MSSLRCGARQRCRRGPPLAARRFTPSRFNAAIVPAALSNHDREAIAGNGHGLVVLREADRFGGRSATAAGADRQLELGGGDFISLLCPKLVLGKREGDSQEVFAPGFGLHCPVGDGDGGFGPRTMAGKASVPCWISTPSSLSVQAASNPERSMNWYLFLIFTVPAARSPARCRSIGRRVSSRHSAAWASGRRRRRPCG